MFPPSRVSSAVQAQHAPFLVTQSGPFQSRWCAMLSQQCQHEHGGCLLSGYTSWATWHSTALLESAIYHCPHHTFDVLYLCTPRCRAQLRHGGGVPSPVHWARPPSALSTNNIRTAHPRQIRTDTRRVYRAHHSIISSLLFRIFVCQRD